MGLFTRFQGAENCYSIQAGGFGIIRRRMDTLLTFCEEDGRRSFPMIIDGICRFASTKRWHVENITSRDRTMEIGRLLDFWKPIGCIAEISPVSTLPIKAFRGVPVVFLNRSPLETDGKASVVEMDHAACVKLAVEELLRGKPAMLGYTPYLIPSRTWNIARQDAFAKMLSERGVPFSLFAPRSKAKRIPRIDFIRQMRSWLKSLPKPCGILAANDETASVVIAACSLEGFKVPQDVSVIGVDDDSTICMNAETSLSSIRPNFTKGAYMAAKLIDRAIRHPDWRGRHVVYPPEGITRRDSTRFVLRHDPEVAAAIDLIQAKACTGLGADEVRRRFTCSRRSADERFRAATRQSILEMIHSVRLSRMQELLSNPDQGLNAIANLCGYASQNAACKFFRLKTGMTMSDWRQKHVGI